MPISLSTVLGAVSQAGSMTPAFKQLFDSVVPLFKTSDQETLKKAYSHAREASDAAHGGLQAAAEQAANR